MSTSLRMFVHSPNNRVSSVGILVNRLVISKLTISDRLYKIGVFLYVTKKYLLVDLYICEICSAGDKLSPNN